MKQIALPALAALLTTIVPAKAAFSYLETFSNDGIDEGWFQVSTGTAPSLSQNPTTDRLDFADADATVFYLVADSLSSGGAFVGNYLADGIKEFTFDLIIDAGSSVSELYFELANLTEGETWQYALALPTFGFDTSFSVPLGGAGWTQTAGSEDFAFILGQTEEIGIAFVSNSSGSMSGSIDNIAAVPETGSSSTYLLAVMGILGASAWKRRNALRVDVS